MGLRDPEAKRAYARAYYASHRDKIKASTKAYRVAHKEQLEGYRLAHHDRRRLTKKLYNDAHRESNKVKCRRRYLAHAEERRAYARAYYAAHRLVSLEQNKLYKQAHPEENRARGHRYNARKSLAVATATGQHEKAIKAAYKYRCAYCGNKTKKLSIDHVKPLWGGGGHTPENLVPACTSCNSRKGHREAPLIPPLRLLL